MSTYQKTRNQKRKLKQAQLMVCCQEDYNPEEFDSYYQKCLQQIKEKHAKQIKKETAEESEHNYSESVTTYYGDGLEDKDGDEDFYTKEEIDLAFAEAERWSDF